MHLMYVQYYKRIMIIVQYTAQKNRSIRKLVPAYGHIDKKENQIFLMYKGIQSGAVAKSYITNGLLKYREIFAHFLKYVLGSPSSYMTLQLLHTEFPYI
jgi:hypothetical protein